MPPIDRNALAQQLGYNPSYLPPTYDQILAGVTPPVAPPPVPPVTGALNTGQPAIVSQMISNAGLATPTPTVHVVQGLSPNALHELEAKHTPAPTKGVGAGGLDIFKSPDEWKESTSADAELRKANAVYAQPQTSTSTAPSFDASKLLGAIGGPTVIPGHEVRRVSPETERLLRKSGEEERAGITDKIAAEQKLIEQQAAGDRELVEIRNREQARQQAHENARQAIIDQHLEEQANLADDIRNFKVDPSKAFGDGVLGGFRRIAAIISVSLGGYAAGLRGGPNLGAQMIDGMIDREIDAQKTELEKRKGLLGESRSLLAQKMAQFGDQRVAEAAAKADVLEAAKAQIEASMAGTKSEIVQANGKLLIAELDDKLGKRNDTILGWQGPTVSAGDPRRKRYDEMVEKLILQHVPVDQAKAMAVQTVFGVDTGAGSMSVPQKGVAGGQAKAALVTQDSAIAEMLETIKREKEVVQKGGHISIEDANQSALRRKTLVEGLPRAISGTSSDAQFKLYDDQLPPPVGYTGSWASEGRMAQYNELERILKGKRAELRKSMQSLSGQGMSESPSEESDTLESAQPLE